MGKQKKSLLCMYVDDFCGIKEESFNFYIERRYAIKKGKISRKHDEEIKDFPTDFWGNNVSAVTLLIGINGAGKTTLMRLLIKWLCQLSAGHIPQEKGALVISVDDKDTLVAFDNGEPWKTVLKKDEEIEYIKDEDEIKNLLSDVRLAYYTDTMTDLELNDTLTANELDFLLDDSLLTRLSNSIEGKYTIDNIKDCIKREDFVRQMKLFLKSQKRLPRMQQLPNCLRDFPIRYMKLTATRAGDEKSFESISNGNGSLIREAIDLWNKVFDDNTNKNLPAIARELLWGLFSGTIISLVSWEKTLPNLEKSIVTEQVRSSLRAYLRDNYSDWNTIFEHFFTNMFSDCRSAFRDVHCHDKFCTKWNEQIRDNINNFLKMLKNIENGELLQKWMPFENIQNIWEFKLEYFYGKYKNRGIVLKEWESLWNCYLAVAHLMPECKFDWKYASSGGKNKSNLYINLFNIIDKCSDIDIKQLWVFLDEPDNAFHPDWERKIIRNLLEICSISNINFQLLISTHSPIMLSDVPKQAAILLKIGEEMENGYKIEKKQQKPLEYSPFGQQIYTLFNDAFIMEHGIIGAFANTIIEEVYNELYQIEGQTSNRQKFQNRNKLQDLERNLEKCKYIINLIEEPLLHGHLSQSYKLCNRRIKQL